jgi:hypothetical protein
MKHKDRLCSSIQFFVLDPFGASILSFFKICLYVSEFSVVVCTPFISTMLASFGGLFELKLGSCEFTF